MELPIQNSDEPFFIYRLFSRASISGIKGILSIITLSIDNTSFNGLSD